MTSYEPRRVPSERGIESELFYPGTLIYFSRTFGQFTMTVIGVSMVATTG